MPDIPYILPFDSIGSGAEGFVTTTQQADRLPFAVKRVFWAHGTPPEVVRGRHAHKATEQMLVAVQGRIRIVVANGRSEPETFMLDAPEKGLYLPPLYWADIYFEEGALLLCLASTNFNEEDYIRTYDEFLQAVSRLKHKQ